MPQSIQSFVIDFVAEGRRDERPYRLANESVEEYRRIRGRNVPDEPIAADIVPPLNIFADFVGELVEARLTNVERDGIEVNYRTGIWDDAWNGTFYYPALTFSARLSYDPRLTQIPEYRGTLKYFGDVRAYRKGRYIFLKKGTSASYTGNALTLPISALSDGSDNPNLVDCHNVFGSTLIEDLKDWLGVDDAATDEEPERRTSPAETFDVFLSHSSRDMQSAKELADYLAGEGRRVFFSPESLPAIGSTDYMKAIDEALDGAQHFILFGTKLENILSSWVEAEWRLFINEKRSGRKDGNILTVVHGMEISDLPISLRYYEVIMAVDDYLNRVLKYVV